MTLTIGNAPLATHPPTEANYTIDGPRHRLLLTPFPRRVRAELAGATVVDTERGALLHESNLLPVLYVPEADVDARLLTPTDHSTHCPFKGDASYWSITVGDRTAENAVWSYPTPIEEATWLRGLMAFYWDRLDRWFDEDDEVFGHLRDPYHRVDVRPSGRRVMVLIDGEVVADTTSAKVLSETGRPNRWYVPADHVRAGALTPSATVANCPYKGRSTYWSTADGRHTDVAWSYEAPLDDARRVAGHLSFDDTTDGVTVEVTSEVTREAM